MSEAAEQISNALEYAADAQAIARAREQWATTLMRRRPVVQTARQAFLSSGSKLALSVGCWTEVGCFGISEDPTRHNPWGGYRV
jgi:aspartate/methionine/tyrosine aminotransferase